MLQTTESRQVRRARERAEAKANKKASRLDSNKINSINEQIVQDLQDPKMGYRLIHQWHTDDGYVNDGKFSVYAPDYRRSMSARADILKRAFGGYESQVFNVLKYLEDKGKMNPFTGNQTYEPFNGGFYDLCIGVWELPEGNYGFGGADNIIIPSAKYALVPMLQHDRGGDKEDRMFGRAYGDSVPLNNLHSMIARANFSSLYTCPHNVNRFKNLDHITGDLVTSSEAVKYNWLAVYNSTYSMYRSTLGGGNGDKDVKVTAGNRDDVTKGSINLHRVFD